MALTKSYNACGPIGAEINPAASSEPRPPAALLPLIQAVADPHQRFDELAVHFGHRYRSGFWAIYLLSAAAVLFGVMPMALGGDSSNLTLHPWAGLWAVGEVMIIGTVSAIYWLGHRRDCRPVAAHQQLTGTSDAHPARLAARRIELVSAGV